MSFLKVAGFIECKLNPALRYATEDLMGETQFLKVEYIGELFL